LRYLFEKYAFDTDRRELHRGANVVPVAPQVFDLLDYLIRNRERVVSKDDLIDAIWNGRIVSDAALTTRLNAARTAIGDSGEEQRLIKTLPRKGFRFVGPVLEAQGPAGPATADNAIEPPRPALTLPDKPSIAILPFTNLSSDPEQDYFADGMVEDIITGLSRSKSLFVIARNSSFTYKGKAVDIKQVGRDLGVRYVLEGSIRRASNRIRITGQLIDAVTGVHLWADRFEGGVGNVFDLQDQVTASVIGAISPKLEQAEIERSRRKPTENLQAYDYYLQGISCLYKFTKEANEQALELFHKAINLDPEFALAVAEAAAAYSQRKGMRLSEDLASEAAQAELLARKALDLAKDDPAVLVHCGMALAFVVGHPEEGAAYLKKGTDLNPNWAPGWFWRGWVQLYLGDAGAIEHFHRAIRLSPLDPRIVIAHSGLAFSYFFAGQYDEALLWVKTGLRETPKHLPTLRIAMASYALSGRSVEARETCLRAMQIDPAQRISNIRNTPFRRDEDVARLAEGFRLAGMPE
jgi:TolB-like protein/tetratricopeptide (TPR) repeat protein